VADNAPCPFSPSDIELIVMDRLIALLEQAMKPEVEQTMVGAQY
jgi:hypothetical protein